MSLLLKLFILLCRGKDAKSYSWYATLQPKGSTCQVQGPNILSVFFDRLIKYNLYHTLDDYKTS